MPAGDGVERRSFLREFAGVEREPGDEADAVFCAMVERGLACPVSQIIAVLDRGDREDLRGRLDLRHADFRQAGAADHLILDQGSDRVELLFGRHLRINAVQLP
jgi:hypothetical protein